MTFFANTAFHCNLIVNGQTIEKVNSCKYLRIIIDDELKWYLHIKNIYKQELSYRQQIARHLRTQFVEGISVTLKSTLRVTQGHWKRKQWTDHTRLTIRRVIGR